MVRKSCRQPRPPDWVTLADAERRQGVLAGRIEALDRFEVPRVTLNHGIPGRVFGIVEYRLIEGDPVSQNRRAKDARDVLGRANHAFRRVADRADGARPDLFRASGYSHALADNERRPRASPSPEAPRQPSSDSHRVILVAQPMRPTG